MSFEIYKNGTKLIEDKDFEVIDQTAYVYSFPEKGDHYLCKNNSKENLHVVIGQDLEMSPFPKDTGDWEKSQVPCPVCKDVLQWVEPWMNDGYCIGSVYACGKCHNLDYR